MAKNAVLMGSCYRRKLFSKLVVTWSSKDTLRYRGPESAVARCRGNVTLPHANNSGAPATATSYCRNIDRKADSDLAVLNGVEESLEHAVPKTELTGQESACQCVDVAVPSSKIDVVNSIFGRGSGVFADEPSSDDALRLTAEVSELLMK